MSWPEVVGALGWLITGLILGGIATLYGRRVVHRFLNRITQPPRS